ncbi:MAG TPA: amidase family protein, partial [Solirubrobacterales bacterium]|nr:amidase family protein [Solirubrobacterales bacterium]
MSVSFEYVPAWRLAELVRAREVSAAEVVEDLVGRLDAPAARELNTFTQVFPERALETARRVDRELADGGDPGALAGVPFTIKDLSPVEGTDTSFGSPAFAGSPSVGNAPVYERMAAAGGVFFAKTTTPEFGSKGTTESPLTGITRNPWDPERTSGGSSGGAAAAVAAGLGPLAQGSDGGGSIRIPASFCGVVGLKPSAGRVPFLPEDSVFETLTHHGPIAGCVRDATLMLDAVAGPHPHDPFSLPAAPRSFLDAVAEPTAAAARPLRIAYSPDLGLGPVDPEVAALVEAAAGCFADRLGAAVEEARLDLGSYRDDMLVMWATSLGYI